jgi:hypothetical protein
MTNSDQPVWSESSLKCDFPCSFRSFDPTIAPSGAIGTDCFTLAKSSTRTHAIGKTE